MNNKFEINTDKNIQLCKLAEQSYHDNIEQYYNK
jgi:hypothetical protein